MYVDENGVKRGTPLGRLEQAIEGKTSVVVGCLAGDLWDAAQALVIHGSNKPAAALKEKILELARPCMEAGGGGNEEKVKVTAVLKVPTADIQQLIAFSRKAYEAASKEAR